jgi:hypothetical protein
LTEVGSRLARVVQQLRSLSELQGRELDHLADQLEAAGVTDLASKLRIFRGLHADEAGLAIQELADLTSALVEPPSEDPAAQSPRRARWLEEVEKTRRATPQPRSRREMFSLRRESGPD